MLWLKRFSGRNSRELVRPCSCAKTDAHAYAGCQFFSRSFGIFWRRAVSQRPPPQSLRDHIAAGRENWYASCRCTNRPCARSRQILQCISAVPQQSCGRCLHGNGAGYSAKGKRRSLYGRRADHCAWPYRCRGRSWQVRGRGSCSMRSFASFGTNRLYPSQRKRWAIAKAQQG